MLGAKESLEMINEKDMTTKGRVKTHNRFYWAAPGHSYMGEEATLQKGRRATETLEKKEIEEGAYTSR